MQSQKRRKTLLACNQCRDRKTRCNGDPPICKSCQERKLLCRYEQNLTKTSSSTAETERRLKSPEEGSLRSYHWTGIDAAICPPPVGSGSDPAYQLVSPRVESRHGVQKDGIVNQPSLGPSSTESLVSHVTTMTDSLKQQMKPDSVSRYNESEIFTPQLPAVSLDHFISNTDVDLTLMECYWQNIHPIFPLLHRPSVLHAYTLLCEPHITESGKNASEMSLFKAILNIVFALGVQFDNRLPFEQRVAMADTFYHRSTNFVALGSVDNPSKSHVQLFLLTAVYLHSTAYATRCWDMVGAGLRVAIGLNLHRENARPHAKESQLERETRRRIWFCCIALDKMSAATFGRPTMLPRSWKVTHPQAIDDEFLQCVGEGTQPPDLPSYIQGFVFSLDLFEILGDVLIIHYDSLEDECEDNSMNQGRTAAERLSDTLLLNSRLDDLIEKMPVRLRLTNNDLDANSLTLIQYVRLLILRPCLLDGIYSARIPLSSSIGQNTITELHNLCVITAQQTIDTIYEAELDSPQNSSWHAVYFLHAAAGILLAAALHPKTHQGIDLALEPYRTSWQKAIQTLKNNELQLQACSQAIKSLESCREKVCDLNKAKEDLSLQDAEIISPVMNFDFDWAFDVGGFDMLRSDNFVNPTVLE